MFLGMIFFWLSTTALAGEPRTPLQIYDTTTQIVTRHFYDPTFRGLNWPAEVARFRTRLSDSSTGPEIVDTLNELLALLKASHTRFFSTADQEYYALESIFSGTLNGYPFFQIGAWYQKIDQNWFVQNVFEGSPAAEAGLRPGDEILWVERAAFEPVFSFSDRSAHLMIRRTRKGPAIPLKIYPVEESVQRTLLTATQKSIKTIESCGKKLAYFHLWTGTHDEFKKSLHNFLNLAQLHSGIILDLRDGFGGADPSYLDPLFSEELKNLPLVTLINAGTRSGKEWLAWTIQQRKRGILIGQKTAGAFLAGRLYDIVPSRFALFLAVSDARSTGVNLEGKGVLPDLVVPAELPYLAGQDPQLETALRSFCK